MAATTMASHTHLNNLPTEVLIDIISNVVYHPSTCSDLRDVCPRFRAVVDNYEHSIVRAILDDQYTWARRQYPGLFSSKAYVQPGWRSLETLFSRVAILSNIKSRCIVIRQSRTEVSAWSTGRALTFHHTGMLLLYRISDCGKSRIRQTINQYPELSRNPRPANHTNRQPPTNLSRDPDIHAHDVPTHPTHSDPRPTPLLKHTLGLDLALRNRARVRRTPPLPRARIPPRPAPARAGQQIVPLPHRASNIVPS